MGATCLTLPSCALTWARSAVLTNLACRACVAPEHQPGLRRSCHALRRALEGIVCQHLTIARVCEVITGLTPIRDGTGPARLLDMVQGRSEQVFRTWTGEQDTSWRDGAQVAAMDGLTGSHDRHQQGTARHGRGDGPRSTSCARPAMLWTPAASASSKPPAGIAAARATPLYAARRTLHTGSDLLSCQSWVHASNKPASLSL